MPLIKQQFKLDMFQQKHSRDPEGLLQSLKDTFARDLGAAVIKEFPYEMISRYDGTLPEMSLNKDHQFVELWQTEFVAITKDKVQRLIELIEIFVDERAGRNDMINLLK